MANYSNLNSNIRNAIKTNGNNEITGTLLQQVLLSMVSNLGAQFQLAGVLSPSTPPITPPDYNVAYLAGPGTYTNFNGIVIPEGRIGVIMYNGSWTVQTIVVGGGGGGSIPVATNVSLGGIIVGPGLSIDASGVLSVVGGGGGGGGTNFEPEATDLELVAPAQSGQPYKLQFADRLRESNITTGKNYIILRETATFASQVATQNAIYEIRYDYDLNGTTITIPANCVLFFNGGKLTNGVVNFNNCSINAPVDAEILTGITVGSSLMANKYCYSKWFGFTESNPDADILSHLLNKGICTIVNNGTYQLTKQIVKTTSTPASITGYNANRTLTVLEFTTTDAFNVKYINIENLTLYGNGSNKGIIINGSYVNIKGCFLDAFQYGVYRSTTIENVETSIVCSIIGNTFSYCRHTGIYILAGQGNAYTGIYDISGNYIVKSGAVANVDDYSAPGTPESGFGIVIGNVAKVDVYDNTLEYCACCGILININNVTRGLRVTRCVFEQNKMAQIILRPDISSIAGLYVDDCVSTYPYQKVSNFLKEWYYDYTTDDNIFLNPNKGVYGYNHFFGMDAEHPVGFNAIESAKYLDYVPGGAVAINPDGYFKMSKDHSGISDFNICYLRKGETIYLDIIFNLVAGSASEYYLIVNQGSQTFVLSRAWDADDKHNIVRFTATEDGYVRMNNSYIAGVSDDFDYRIRIVHQVCPPYLAVSTSVRNNIKVLNYPGYTLFDTTLNKMVMFNGTTWVNVDGSALT